MADAVIVKPGSGIAFLITLAVGCGGDAEPPLPAASPFPTRGVRLGMSPAELLAARPGVELGTDGVFREAHQANWVVYGFEPRREGTPPAGGATLRYVELAQELWDTVTLENRWSESLRSFAGELGTEPECASAVRGNSRLRRAVFRSDPRVYVTTRVTRGSDGRGLEMFLTTAVMSAEEDAEGRISRQWDWGMDASEPCLDR